MISWSNTGQEHWGNSNVTDWNGAILDLQEMLDKLFTECITSKANSAYIEMWPDSGRFICYPADSPSDGVLAERETKFLVQLRFAFWRERWEVIASDESTSDDDYQHLRTRAIAALREALVLSVGASKLKVNSPGFFIYVFEYEGTEGVAKLALNGVEIG